MNKKQLLQQYNEFLTRKTGFDPDILDHCLKEFLGTSGSSYQLMTDGASSGNPGPAGAGILIKKEGKAVSQHSYSLGIATNNEAEYWALIIGLYHLISNNKNCTVHHVTDSELLARQMKGIYRVKNERIKTLWKTAQNLIQLISGYEVTSLPREHLGEADSLAREGSQAGQTSGFEKIKKHLKAKGFLEERA